MKKYHRDGMVTMGMDISDRSCHVIALSQEDGELVERTEAREATLGTESSDSRRSLAEVFLSSGGQPYRAGSGDSFGVDLSIFIQPGP